MTADDIISRVCARRGVTGLQAKGPSRVAHIARARHEAQWLLREATEMSLPEIGRLFYGRDHTTVLSAVRKIQRLVEATPSYGDELRLIARMSIVEQQEAVAEDIVRLAMELSDRRERLRGLVKLSATRDVKRAA